MGTRKPDSKAGQLRKADKVLRALLKTPKSRPGLLAAVVGGSISRNYVFGWLAEGRRDGSLTVFKSGAVVMYQLPSANVDETPPPSGFPTWLDPRALPPSTGRTVVVGGVVIRVNGKKL